MKTVSVTLLVLLVCAIVINIILYKYAFKYYRASNHIRLDPLGLQHISPRIPSLSKDDTDKPVVLFYGDSRAAQWPFPDTNNYRFINLGIAYQTTEQIYRRSFFQEKLLEKADIIVIQMGINDLKNITIFPNRQEQIIQNCQNNIKLLTDKLGNMKKHVILSTIFPTGKPDFLRQFFWSEKVTSARKEVNHFIRSLAKDNITILNTFSSVDKNHFNTLYAKDLLHLNRAGYKKVNLELLDILENLKRNQLQ